MSEVANSATDSKTYSITLEPLIMPTISKNCLVGDVLLVIDMHKRNRVAVV